MASENVLFDPTEPSSRLEPVLFTLFLVIATILYLVTKEPVLAAFLPCFHGGWRTFHTGRWIAKNDPDRSRATICFVFYTAAACWKAAASALLSVGLFIYAAVEFGFQPDINEFTAVMLVVAAGTALNTCVGLWAIYAAIRHKVRVWIHPRLRAMTGGDLRAVAKLRPPWCGFNHAVFVVATALIFPVLAVGTITVAWMSIGLGRDEMESVAVTVFMFIMLLGAPLAMIPCYVWLSSRIVARRPQECWPEMTLDQATSVE